MTDLALPAAHGEMAVQVGAPFELVWRNDDLSDRPGQRPPGLGVEPFRVPRSRPREDDDRWLPA